MPIGCAVNPERTGRNGGEVEIFGLGGWEPVVLLVVFLLIVGPQRLPEYTRNVIRGVRRAREWVDQSRATVEDEMGIAIDDLRKYDPRQYDPRRIIREAWGDTNLEDILPSKESMTIAAGGAATGSAAVGAAAVANSSTSGSSSGSSSRQDDGPQRAPFDPEAT